MTCRSRPCTLILGFLLGNQIASADLQPQATPGEAPHGLTTDGSTLWIADNSSRDIHRLNAQGEVLGSFRFGNGSPRGLAFHDGDLYIATSSRIYRVNPIDGQVRATFSSPDSSSPGHQGLAYGDGKLWVASRGTDDRIFSINPETGSLIDSFPSPGSNPRGLTFHQGSLWHQDSTTELVYQLSPTTGAVLVSYPSPLGSPRGLTVFQGAFVQADISLGILMSFQASQTYSEVYVVPQRYQIPDSSLQLPFLSSHPINQPNPTIRRLLFYQHGVSDNAGEYFGRALHATKLAGCLEETLIIAFQLLDDSKLQSTPPSNLIYWTGGRFWGGRSASSSAPYPRSQRHSAYAILDAFLAEITADPSRFPNLNQIVLSGHSGGGQLINRYAASSQFEDLEQPDDLRDIRMTYIVMNPSSYVYFNDERADLTNLDLANHQINFTRPSSPPRGYNDYGYGLQDLYHYQANVGATQMRTQYPGRKVIYLIGQEDTGTSNLDTDPEAQLQGANRYERAIIYYAHLKDFFGSQNLPQHRMNIVPGVGHNGLDMIASSLGLQYHFQDPLKMSGLNFSNTDATLTWSGGDGRADIEVSDNLTDWAQIATKVTSPWNDPTIDLQNDDQRFYRLKEAAGP